MGMRFRKSKKIVDGIRANISAGGVSLTLGRPGRSINIGRRGIYVSVGVPGSGLSYNKKLVSFPKSSLRMGDGGEGMEGEGTGSGGISIDDVAGILGKACMAACLAGTLVKGIREARDAGAGANGTAAGGRREGSSGARRVPRDEGQGASAEIIDVTDVDAAPTGGEPTGNIAYLFP